MRCYFTYLFMLICVKSEVCFLLSVVCHNFLSVLTYGKQCAASKRIYGVHPIIRYAILLLFNLIHTPKSWKSLIFVYNEHCSQLTDVMIQQAQLFTQQRSHKIKYKYRLTFIPVKTLQSIMNAKLSQDGFWHCHENGLIKTIGTIPHNLLVSVKSAFFY